MITNNLLKKYEHGYPCMLQDVVGRIVGESENGSWGMVNGIHMFTIPIFATPHGTTIQTSVLYLSEITDDGMKTLLQYEADAKEKKMLLYAGKYTV